MWCFHYIYYRAQLYAYIYMWLNSSKKRLGFSIITSNLIQASRQALHKHLTFWFFHLLHFFLTGWQLFCHHVYPIKHSYSLRPTCCSTLAFTIFSLHFGQRSSGLKYLHIVQLRITNTMGARGRKSCKQVKSWLTCIFKEKCTDASHKQKIQYCLLVNMFIKHWYLSH